MDPASNAHRKQHERHPNDKQQGDGREDHVWPELPRGVVVDDQRQHDHDEGRREQDGSADSGSVRELLDLQRARRPQTEGIQEGATKSESQSTQNTEISA